MTDIRKLDPITDQERAAIAVAALRANMAARGLVDPAARHQLMGHVFRKSLRPDVLALVAIRNYQLQPRRRRWWWLVRSCWGD